jgi:hypothetical protein
MTMTKIIPAEEVFAEWSKDPGYRKAYDALDGEFAILEAQIKARAEARQTERHIVAPPPAEESAS